jgi:hypothetical protein
MKYTVEKLKEMTLKERRSALDNNKSKLSDPKFAELAAFNISLIETSGLKLGPERPLQKGDWQLVEMELIVNDPANEAAMLAAVARGEPPLGVIEPLIIEKLGTEYKTLDRRDAAGVGNFIAIRLKALGYETIEGGGKRMPSGSLAKTGSTFRKTMSKT